VIEITGRATKGHGVKVEHQPVTSRNSEMNVHFVDAARFFERNGWLRLLIKFSTFRGFVTPPIMEHDNTQDNVSIVQKTKIMIKLKFNNKDYNNNNNKIIIIIK
jgi:hypothetical protein